MNVFFWIDFATLCVCLSESFLFCFGFCKFTHTAFFSALIQIHSFLYDLIKWNEFFCLFGSFLHFIQKNFFFCFSRKTEWLLISLACYLICERKNGKMIWFSESTLLLLMMVIMILASKKSVFFSDQIHENCVFLFFWFRSFFLFPETLETKTRSFFWISISHSFCFVIFFTYLWFKVPGEF